MDFKNTKVRVNSTEQSRKVQEKMFELGFSWSGKKSSQYLNERYLIFYNDMTICYCSSEENFNQEDKREVKVSDILEGHKEISPTHLVIWDTENIDPYRFFTSKEEVDDFIKELVEKRDVKKDSIVLIEIKTAKKIQVVKTLKSNKNYKI